MRGKRHADPPNLMRLLFLYACEPKREKLEVALTLCFAPVCLYLLLRFTWGALDEDSFRTTVSFTLLIVGFFYTLMAVCGGSILSQDNGKLLAILPIRRSRLVILSLLLHLGTYGAFFVSIAGVAAAAGRPDIVLWMLFSLLVGSTVLSYSLLVGSYRPVAFGTLIAMMIYFMSSVRDMTAPNPPIWIWLVCASLNVVCFSAAIRSGREWNVSAVEEEDSAIIGSAIENTPSELEDGVMDSFGDRVFEKCLSYLGAPITTVLLHQSPWVVLGLAFTFGAFIFSFLFKPGSINLTGVLWMAAGLAYPHFCIPQGYSDSYLNSLLRFIRILPIRREVVSRFALSAIACFASLSFYILWIFEGGGLGTFVVLVLAGQIGVIATFEDIQTHEPNSVLRFAVSFGITVIVCLALLATFLPPWAAVAIIPLTHPLYRLTLNAWSRRR